MIYQVQVKWECGDDDGKVLAVVQEKDLESACSVARQAVRKMRGPGSSVIDVLSAQEMNQTVVLIPDGEKPKWLTREEAKDEKGQTTIKGTEPGDGARKAK